MNRFVGSFKSCILQSVLNFRWEESPSDTLDTTNRDRESRNESEIKKEAGEEGRRKINGEKSQPTEFKMNFHEETQYCRGNSQHDWQSV